jgi:hypothetical protein
MVVAQALFTIQKYIVPVRVFFITLQLSLKHKLFFKSKMSWGGAVAVRTKVGTEGNIPSGMTVL